MTKYSQNQNIKVPVILGTERLGRVAAVLDLRNEYVVMLFPVFVAGKLTIPGEAMTVTEEWMDMNVVAM